MGTAKSYGHKNWKRINKIWKIFVVIKSSKVIQGKRNWVKKVMFKKNWLGLKPPSHMGLRDSQIEMENPPTQHYESSIFFAHFSCTLLFKVYIFENAIYLDNLLSKPGDLVYCQNPISGISHLLLIRFGPNCLEPIFWEP